MTILHYLSLQVRFLHDPSKDTGYVGCALTTNMVRFFKTKDGSWSHEVCSKLHANVLLFSCNKVYFPTYLHSFILCLQLAISIKPLKVCNWILPEMPVLIIDFVLSLDDRYLYLVNWLHGIPGSTTLRTPQSLCWLDKCG